MNSLNNWDVREVRYNIIQNDYLSKLSIEEEKCTGNNYIIMMNIKTSPQAVANFYRAEDRVILKYNNETYYIKDSNNSRAKLFLLLTYIIEGYNVVVDNEYTIHTVSEEVKRCFY